MHTLGGTFASTPVRLHNDMFHDVFPTLRLTMSTWNWGPCFRNGRCRNSHVNGLRHSYLLRIYGEGGFDLSNIVVVTPHDGTQIRQATNGLRLWGLPAQSCKALCLPMIAHNICIVRPFQLVRVRLIWSNTSDSHALFHIEEIPWTDIPSRKSRSHRVTMVRAQSR